VKATELRELPDEELLIRLEGQKEELFNLRFQMATGQLDNPMRMKDVRHDIARILTVLRGRLVEADLEEQVAEADRRSLEERRDAIARGELKGEDLRESMGERAITEEGASAGLVKAGEEDWE
jgi:large subunit ribosomal protein L29